MVQLVPVRVAVLVGTNRTNTATSTNVFNQQAISAAASALQQPTTSISSTTVMNSALTAAANYHTPATAITGCRPLTFALDLISTTTTSY